jgi:hypothetical protein
LKDIRERAGEIFRSAGCFRKQTARKLGGSAGIRELLPDASWRAPLLLFTSMAGMAFGAWFAGALYDYFGFYAPAFAVGALFNLGNLAIIGFLVARQTRSARLASAQAV